MQTVEKVRWILVGITFIIIAVWLVIPTIQESNRQKKVNEQDVEEYIKNSEVISLHIDDIQIIKEESVSYTDAVMTSRHSKYKSILLFKNNKDGKYYSIELYYRGNFYVQTQSFKDMLYLVVNKDDYKDQGTEDNPIIALRYYTDEKYSDVEVTDKEYQENVHIYLTYKDFEPTSLKVLGIRALIVTIIIIGGLICTYIMKKKGIG